MKKLLRRFPQEFLRKFASWAGPTCRQPNRLTESDRRQGYQCNECADRDEGEW